MLLCNDGPPHNSLPLISKSPAKICYSIPQWDHFKFEAMVGAQYSRGCRGGLLGYAEVGMAERAMSGCLATNPVFWKSNSAKPCEG